MAQREAMILLLVASGCQLDDNAHDAALGVLSASGQLPLEMILLGSMAKLRPGKRGRSCRSVDLEYLGHQLREKPAEGALSCLVRTFWMAVRELHPQDETMYLRLGACTGDLHFSLPLLKAMWGHGAHGTMSTEEVVALVGHLEQRHLLKRKGDVLGDAWQIPAVLHHHLAAELQNDAHAWSTAERRYLAYMRQCAVILVATDHSQRLLIEPFATDRSFEFMASSLQAENRPSSEMNFHCMADTTMPEKYYTACFPIADVKHVSGADQTPVSHNPIYHQDPDAWQPPAPTQRTSLKPEPFPCLEKDIARHSSMQLIPDRDSDDDSIPKPEPPGEAVPIRVPTRDAGVQSRQRTETSDIGALHDILAGLALQCDLEAPSAESPVSLQDEATLAVAAADAITVTVADAGTGMPRSALRQPLNPSTPLNSSLKKLASLTVPAAQISQLDMSIESRGAPSMASAQTCTSVDNSGAATYSDRGELLSIMEESLRTQLGEGAVANLPPPPEAISAEGEVLHYHYHYHPSLSSSLSGSPEARSPRGMSPAATMVSAPSPLFRTSGIELVAPGEFDLASEIPTTASHKLRGTDEVEFLQRPLYNVLLST